MRARALAALFACGVMLASPLAGAQSAGASKSAAASKKLDNKKAAETAVRALKLYREGKHEEAALLFLEAYDLSKRPAQLRNAAKAYGEGGFLDESLALWKRYRDHDGLSEDERAEAVANVKLVEEKKKNAEIAIAAEKARVAAEAAAAEAERARAAAVATEEASRASRVEAERGPGIAPWIVVGSGGAAIVTGGVVWLLQSSRLSSLDDKLAQTDANGLINGTSPAEVSSEVSGINSMRIVSGVLVGVGVAAVGGGLAWWLLGGSGESGAPSVAVAPIVGAGGAGLGVSGSF